MNEPAGADRLTRLARGALFLTLGVPLYIGPGLYFPFVSLRGLVFRALVAFAAICFLLSVLTAHRIERGDRDWTLLALTGFLGVSALSAFLGYAWQRSIFGTFARLGGVWTWVHLVGLYALLRATFEARHWLWFLRGIVGVGLLAAVYGLLQRYQLQLGIRWEGSPNPPNGPLGNYGIFAGYLLFPIGVACRLAIMEASRSLRAANVAAAAVLLWMLWLTTNRSSLLGVMCGIAVGAVCYSWFSGRARRTAFAVVIGFIALAAAVAAMRPGQPLAPLAEFTPHTVRRFVEVGPGATGVDRRIQWRAAVLATGERPLLGYGPENHEIVWSRHFDPAMYGLQEDLLWDRTHNAFLETLATTGWLGFAALLSVWAGIFATIVAGGRRGRFTAGEAAVLLGLNVAYAVYLWFWFFDLTATAFWLALAAYVSTQRRSRPLLLGGRIPWRWQSALIAAGVLAVGGTLLWSYSIAPILEARKLGRLQLLVEARPLRGSPAALVAFRQQLDMAPMYSVPGALFLSQYLSALAPQFAVLRDDPEFARELAATLEQSVRSLERARAADPLNDRLMTVKTRIMIRASQFYGSPEMAALAEATAREGIVLNPRRVGPRLVLAALLLSDGRHQEALAQTDTALLLYPRSPDAHGVRASIYLASGQPDSAAVSLYAAMPPVDTAPGTPPSPRTDPALVLGTAQALVQSGNPAEAARLVRFYLFRWYGPYAEWRRQPSSSVRHARLDRTAASILPALSLRAGQRAEARAAATAFSTICPPARAPVQEFIAATADEGAVGYSLSLVTDAADLPAMVAAVTALCEPRPARGPAAP